MPSIVSHFRRERTRDASFGVQPGVRIVPDPEMRGREVSTLNRLVDISDWEPGSPLSLRMQELGEGTYVHRKSWEYAICVEGLHQLGGVEPGSVALAVAAG